MKLYFITYLLTISLCMACGSGSRVELGETVTEYIFEDDENLNFTNNYKSVEGVGLTYACQIVKIDPPNKCRDVRSYLTYDIVEGMRSEAIKIYDIDNSKEEQSFDRIDSKYIERDTLIYYDPETYEENVIFKTKNLSELIKSFKIMQKWYFNEGSNSVENEVVKIVPLAWMVDHNNELVKREVCVIRNNKRDKKADVIINNPNVRWVKKSLNDFEADSPILKNDKSKEMLNELFFSLPINGKVQTYYPSKDYSCLNELSISNYKEMISDIRDTLITFDPSTYEEHIRVTQIEVQSVNGLSGITVEQLWYYDAKLKSLNSKVLGMTPFVFGRHLTNKYTKHAKYELVKDELFQVQF